MFVMWDPAACVSFMCVPKCASGLLVLALSVASVLHVWGRVFGFSETVAVLRPLSISFLRSSTSMVWQWPLHAGYQQVKRMVM